MKKAKTTKQLEEFYKKNRKAMDKNEKALDEYTKLMDSLRTKEYIAKINKAKSIEELNKTYEEINFLDDGCHPLLHSNGIYIVFITRQSC